MSDLSIRDIITKITEGVIRIPAFQRGFVWDSESVAFLMDSIYKEFPFGTIQFWRTREKLRTERSIGIFDIFPRDDQYPIDYVLDGQQRITSIFGVFQNDIEIPDGIANPFEIYFDFKADQNLQESQFFALTGVDVDLTRHFPLNVLFDTVKYRRATRGLEDADLLVIDKLQSVFKEAKIPTQTLETNDKAKVSIVFERINRKGVPLDNFQLLSAWTWSEDFDLQNKFEDLTAELQPFGFEDVGSNANLLMRISSAILVGDSATGALININGAEVRDRFDEILNGIRGAIDFLKRNLRVEKLDNLPYSNLLIPLSVFFSNSGNQHFTYSNGQRLVLEKWFWRACFSRRYSAGVLRSLNRDVEEILRLKRNEPSELVNIPVSQPSDFFLTSTFVMGTVNTKTFILLLAQNSPRSFISGSPITLSEVLKDYNRNEFHHIYPKSFLRQEGELPYDEACLANFCFLSRSDNQRLGGSAPSVYRDKLGEPIEGILESAFINPDALFADDFQPFVEDRNERLLAKVNALIN